MPINDAYDKDAIKDAISKALKDFYQALTQKVNGLSVNDVVKRKNPYLFRAKAMNSAPQIVGAVLSAYISSSEETIFGNVFFEPIATVASKGQKALAEGIDIMIERADTIYAIAVKSGTSVFNADSRKKQEQNFVAATALARQARKRFYPIIGYGYGRKKISARALPRIYVELAGKDFWTELTGDPDFYIELIRLMEGYPEIYADEFMEAYQNAENRLLRDFTVSFCRDDGSIDWPKLLEFNSGD